MKKEIFKVGDKVYHMHYGWGIVRVIDNSRFPIKVQFKLDFNFDQIKTFEYIISFSIGGVEHEDEKYSLLSFTEYTLQGFSQERPVELPEVGELCLFRDYNDECWRGVEFKMYDKTKDFPFRDSNGDGWLQMKRIKIL